YDSSVIIPAMPRLYRQCSDSVDDLDGRLRQPSADRPAVRSATGRGSSTNCCRVGIWSVRCGRIHCEIRRWIAVDPPAASAGGESGRSRAEIRPGGRGKTTRPEPWSGTLTRRGAADQLASGCGFLPRLAQCAALLEAEEAQAEEDDRQEHE